MDVELALCDCLRMCLNHCAARRKCPGSLEICHYFAVTALRRGRLRSKAVRLSKPSLIRPYIQHCPVCCWRNSAADGDITNAIPRPLPFAPSPPSPPLSTNIPNFSPADGEVQACLTEVSACFRRCLLEESLNRSEVIARMISLAVLRARDLQSAFTAPHHLVEASISSGHHSILLKGSLSFPCPCFDYCFGHP